MNETVQVKHRVHDIKAARLKEKHKNTDFLGKRVSVITNREDRHRNE